MPASKLGLYELLAPQFLLGVSFEPHIDRYLSTLGVDELRTTFDESGVVYTGRLSFGGTAGASPVREHRDPSGMVVEWPHEAVDFRLTLPRDGAEFIGAAVGALALAAPLDQAADDLDQLFSMLGPVEGSAAVATEFPGVRFRLELLLSSLSLHLRPVWVPGKVGPDFRVVRDLDSEQQDVTFVLPKVLLRYEQGDNLSLPPTFELRSWGNSGFEAPHDLAQGEIVRMVPPIALHENGRWAFGVDQVLLDLSQDHTPPEILAFFGADEAFRGLFIKSMRFFYTDEDKDFGFGCAVNDALISFAGEVSLEARADIFGPQTKLEVVVDIFEGQQKIEYDRGVAEDPSQPNVFVDGHATLSAAGTVLLNVGGGVPPYTVSVKLDGQELWDPAKRMARLPANAPGEPLLDRTLVVTVVDSAPPAGQGPGGPLPDPKHHFSQTIELTTLTVAAGDALDDAERLSADQARHKPAVLEFTVDSDQPVSGYTVSHSPSEEGISETLVFLGGIDGPQLTLTIDGQTEQRQLDGGSITFDVPPGAEIGFSASYDAILSDTVVPEPFKLFFKKSRPATEEIQEYIDNAPLPADTRFTDSSTHSDADKDEHGAERLRDWIRRRGSPDSIEYRVEGHASYENTTNATSDLELSKRRRNAAIGIIGDLATLDDFETDAKGQSRAAAANRKNSELDRVAEIKVTLKQSGPAVTITGTISRPPDEPNGGDGGGGGGSTDTTEPPPNITTEAPKKPPALRRLSLRARLERNVPVLVELSGELDFQTDLERKLAPNPAPPDGEQPGCLNFKQQPGASAVPDDGVVDWKINVTYDTATGFLTETLTLGADPDDTNGLLRLNNPRAADGSVTACARIGNIVGALLVFTPVINSAAGSLDPNSAGDWVALAASLAAPTIIGGLDVFQTTAATLYGGELRSRQFAVPGETFTVVDAGIVFDYGVEFNIDIPLLEIKTQKPLKVRYKAVGFNLHFPGGVAYQPIFDTSKGYEINLSDPGLFRLPDPLGDVLQVTAARIARFNPLTLEVDLGITADLGVVTVDKFKIKLPLPSEENESVGPPMLIPAGIRVEVPNVVAGSGYLKIEDGNFAGALDLTIIPIKLRVAAGVGVEAIEDLASGRTATAVFANLTAQFGSPIVLLGTGLGIYGFSGLFAMHYRRTEKPPEPGSIVSPALEWLERAKGEPHRLTAANGAVLWEPALDRWSFGLGMVLGTLDGGFLTNLRGMFVLELPGPRLLIFVKAQAIMPLPGLGDGELKQGMLGVVDLDFNLGQLTVGITVDVSIKKLLAIKIPVELFYKLGDTRNWHLFAGTIQQPASAKVLNLFRASGYFMLAGHDIQGFPTPGGPITLPGIAVAAGLRAAVLYGDEGIGLFLRAAAEANLGIAFSPFFISGNIALSGELHLFIVGIEARGSLTVEAPDPTFIRGEICAKIDLFFFSLEGCVGIAVGSSERELPAPPLARGVYLQSHAPVIAAGQGGDRPIDASLGNAALLPDDDVPSVPIDALPVLQFHAAPLISAGGVAADSFTEPLLTPPGLVAPDGWVDVGGGRRVRYLLRQLELLEGASGVPWTPPSGAGLPPATWRRDRAPGVQGADTNIDLALFSRVPFTASRALERSTELTTLVTERWAHACDPIAPPRCVLWTFGGQPLGPSGSGWTLDGTPQPDPPGTTRNVPPPTRLVVEEPQCSPRDTLLNLVLADAGVPFDIPARVVGLNRLPEPPSATERRIDFSLQPEGSGPNPRVEAETSFRVRDASGKQAATTQIQSIGGHRGLLCGAALEIVLPSAATELALMLHGAAPAQVTAFDKRGREVAAAVTSVPAGQPQVLKLAAAGIARIVVTVRQGKTLLLELRAVEPPAAKVVTVGQLARSRALELPEREQAAPVSPLGMPVAVDEHANNRANPQHITLRTGAAERVRLLVAVAVRLLDGRLAVLRELDADGKVLGETALRDLEQQALSGATGGLPPEWVDPSGPWRDDVLPVLDLLARPEYVALSRLVLSLEPRAGCVQLQLLILPNQVPIAPPDLLLGVVEVCSAAERGRAEVAEQIRGDEIATLVGYLNGGDVVPLLDPGTSYTLKLRYDAESQAQDGTIAVESGLEQAFRFRTDDAPPARLDPWVLGTTPDHEAQHHFYGDPVRIVFNDLSVVQLFSAYGKQLRLRLRGADGAPVPIDDPALEQLDQVPASFSTPFRDTLARLVDEKLKGCAGEVSSATHAGYTAPVQLQPLMAYTLDVELDPPDAAATDRPIVPLYRRTFATSRFADLQELAEDLRGRRILHRALGSPLAGLPDHAASVVAADAAIEQALRDAGERVLPAPSEPAVTVYWAPRAADGRFVPHALLLDSVEPLWRSRSEPRLETVPDQDDPQFQRVVPQLVEALAVVEPDGATITRFVRSPGGTRTLCLLAPELSPPADGPAVRLALHRAASELYGIQQETVALLDLFLSPHAPWEDADV